MKALVSALALVLGLFASQASFAASSNVWEGNGTLFDVKGSPTDTYSLVVENQTADKETQSNVTVTLSNGKVEKHQCTITQTAEGQWTSKCDFGKGGGHCFGEGLCINYEEDTQGRAFATTIVMDGPSDMRLLRTELQSGKATQFFREKLHKK